MQTKSSTNRKSAVSGLLRPWQRFVRLRSHGRQRLSGTWRIPEVMEAQQTQSARQ